MSKFLKLKFIVGELTFSKSKYAGEYDVKKYVHRECFVNSNLIQHFGECGDVPCDGATGDNYSSCEGAFLKLSEEGVNVIDEICFREVPYDDVMDEMVSKGWGYVLSLIHI